MSGVERMSVYCEDDPEACAEANRRIIEELATNQSFHTVLLAFSDRGTTGPRFAYSVPGAGAVPTASADANANDDIVREGLDRAVTRLEQAGKQGVLVLDNPRLPDPTRCMERRGLAVPSLRN